MKPFSTIAGNINKTTNKSFSKAYISSALLRKRTDQNITVTSTHLWKGERLGGCPLAMFVLTQEETLNPNPQEGMSPPQYFAGKV
eukprot:265402-Amphidinium_carterae.1